MEDRTYRVTLIELLEKCTSLIDNLKHTEYRRKSMLKLFSAYYDCIGEKPDRQLTKTRIQLNPGIILGGGLMEYRRINNVPTGNFDWGAGVTALSVTGGGFLELKRARSSSVSVRLAIAYTSSSTVKSGVTTQERKPRGLELSASSLDLRLGVKKLIWQRRLPLYAELGLAGGYLFNVDDYRFYEFTPGFSPELDTDYTTGQNLGGYVRLSTSLGKWNAGLLYQYKVQNKEPEDNITAGVLLLIGYSL